MKYSRFELLAFILGLIVVGLTTYASIRADTEIVEIVGQLLILLVILGALHYGRNGGIVTFMIASTFYTLLRLPMISQYGFESSVLELLFIRFAIYGVIGILGGEIVSRLKYLFVSLEHHDFIDAATSLYNYNFFTSLVHKSIQNYDRTKKPFSVLIVELTEEAMSAQQGQIDKKLREIGIAIRNNLRVLDEVGRLGERQFGALLINTPREGAVVVKNRIKEVMARLMRHFGHQIPLEVLVKLEVSTYPEDSDVILSDFPAEKATESSSAPFPPDADTFSDSEEEVELP